MKRLLLLGVIALLSVSLAGAGAKKEARDVIKVGVSLPVAAQEIWVRGGELMKQYGEAKGWQVLVQFANDDEKQQVSQIENMLTQGIDALVVTPVDYRAIERILKEAHDMGVRVATYIRPASTSPVDYHVRVDYSEVGKEQARYATLMHPKGNYAIISGDEGDLNSRIITNGSLDYLKPYVDRGDIKVVYQQFIPHWRTENALRAAEDALTANNNNIQAFVVNNDSMALGVSQAVKAQGLSGKVYISGLDGDLANCQQIVEGLITCTFFSPHEDRAHAITEGIEAILNGKEPENHGKLEGAWVFNSPPRVVTKENMYEVIVKPGYQPLEGVYANIPKAQWPKE